MKAQDFEHTLLRMRPKMMRVATDFFHNTEDAEDVVQEVFVRMLQRGWRKGDDVEGLLIRATKNLCVSVWRRQKLREAERLTDVAEPPGSMAADAPLLQSEQEATLEEAIRRLPPSEQRLIRMRQRDDLSSEEIAQQTGISRRVVSNTLWSAKRRLLTLLKKKDNDR